MVERAVFMPLAQVNTSGGSATAAAPAPAAPAAPPTVVAPALETATGAAPTTGTMAPGTSTATATASQPAPTGNILTNLGPLIPMVLILGALYFFLTRGQRKEEKRRKSLMSELKKGDRVMTIGGMLAKVVSVDGDEVVLKIDEAANVKATYRKTAIQEVIDRDDKK